MSLSIMLSVTEISWSTNRSRLNLLRELIYTDGSSTPAARSLPENWSPYKRLGSAYDLLLRHRNGFRTKEAARRRFYDSY